METSQPALDSEKDAKQTELNAPELNSQGKPTQRAITTAKQAWSIGCVVRDAAINGGRIKMAGKISDLYAGEQPYKPSALKAAGQDWRNNYSTNFLASIIDRVKPQLIDPIHKTERLTHSVLPDTYQDAAVKSRLFADVVTKTIRSWPEWKDFIGRLSQDVTLFGNAAPARIDENWRPRLFRYNQTFLPDGSGQHASKAQYMVFIEDMYMHEFLRLFEDQKAADKNGYNIENCIKFANEKEVRIADSTTDAISMSDKARDGATLADTYTSQGTRTVQLMHVLVHDYTGEVDLWTVSNKDGIELRNVEGLHERMDDSSAFFTAQTGNGHYYGSKGLGRLIGNLHVAIEKGRCMAHDLVILSGMPIFEGDPTKPNKIQSKVMFPFLVVNSQWKPVEAKWAFKYEDYREMDNNLVRCAESIAGSFIPPQVNDSGGANTKIEAAQRAAREMAVKEGVLGRWFEQFSNLVGMMQRGIFSWVNLREGKRAFEKKQEKELSNVRVIARKIWKLIKKAFTSEEENKGIAPASEVALADPEAVSAVVELLEGGLTIEEIATLALTPTGDNGADEGNAKDDKTLQFITQNKMNPHIDQQKSTQLEAEITMGKDRAAELVIDDADPNVKAVASRQQTIELGEMLDGREMPVASVDNHKIHRETLGPAIVEMIKTVQTAPTQENLTTARMMLNHQAQHITMDPLITKQEAQDGMKAIQQGMQLIDKQEKELAKIAAEVEANGPPAGQPGAQTTQGAPEDGQEQRDNASLGIEGGRLALEGKKAQLQETQLQFEREKFAHQQQKDQSQDEKDRIKLAADLHEKEQRLDIDRTNKEAEGSES